MNHFLLPEVPESQRHMADNAARYGSVAMERLVNELLKCGARRERLVVKVFGGARVIETSYDIGDSNARFVIDYVTSESLILGGQDLGGTMARRVHYFPATGKALRRLLRPDALTDAAKQEMRFRSTLSVAPVEGEIDLFGED
jgi:chemotaxis protein CheD